MQPKKYDSFSPKRATNIDGFFAKPAANRPRQPVFRSSTAKPQPVPAKLADMPKRSQPQPILASSQVSSGGATVAYPLGGERRRKRVGESALEEPKKKRKDKKEKTARTWKQRAKRSAAFAGALVLLFGLWFGFKFYRDIAKLTGNNNPLSLLSVFHPVPLKNQSGRVNILVAANSADDPGHNGANLTDSIMVLSLNTKNNTALILSIPRDLWVNIPGVGHSKINAAYPNGGMDTLQQVVESNLGLTIDYQMLVNYSAIEGLVNAVGSITININSDDPRGIYDPSVDYTTRNCCALAKYPNGPATLNGHQALDLARARGDAYGSYGYAQSDFTRTMYQREMAIAIKDKASKSSVIANPFKVGSIVDSVGNNIKTNLKLNEIETLYTYMKKVDDTKIASYNINTLKGANTTMLANYTSPDGQSALIPAAGIDDFSAIDAQITKILSANPIAREGATVEVLNATDTMGLASSQGAQLGKQGMNVAVDDATANQATTTIVDNSNGVDPNTLAYLKKKYNATVITSTTLTANYPLADFIVVLGQNAVPKTTPTQTGN